MIQRIQTVFLLAGSVLLGMNYLLDEIWTGPAAHASSWFTPVTLGLYSLGLIGGVLSVFMYRMAEQQRQAIGLVVIVSLIGAVVGCAGLYIGGSLPFVSADVASWQPIVAVILPLASIVCFVLARRSIANDIALLKSVDRLR